MTSELIAFPETITSAASKWSVARNMIAPRARNGRCNEWHRTEPFDRGTNSLAKAAAQLTRAGKLQTIAGGGDTLAALAAANVKDSFSYISNGGGAFMEWLEGRVLPGLSHLRTTNA